MVLTSTGISFWQDKPGFEITGTARHGAVAYQYTVRGVPCRAVPVRKKIESVPCRAVPVRENFESVPCRAVPHDIFGKNLAFSTETFFE